jgi:hypothetical protein
VSGHRYAVRDRLIYALPFRQNLAWIENVVWVERLLDAAHQVEINGEDL